MRFLLDTRVLLWVLQDYSSLGVDTRLKMRSADYIYVSAASVAEVYKKAEGGLVEMPEEFLAAVTESGFKELPVSWEAVVEAAGIELEDRGWTDRVLLAQGQLEQLKLLTADDGLLKAYPGLCVDARG
jgi:PIN domain nuclease of toxin-antitoxin system